MTGGLALISSLGNLGPAMSPSINGLIIRNTGDNIYSMYFVIALYLLSGIFLLLAIRSASTAGVPAAPAHYGNWEKQMSGQASSESSLWRAC